MRYILLLADHWIPCHPRCMKRKAHLASSAFSLTPLFHHFFFFFQILFSFSTWQRSLKRLSFPNQKLFPDSLPLSYNYSAGPCFSALFFFFFFQHCLFWTRGVTSHPQRGKGGYSYSISQRSGCSHRFTHT